MRCSACPLPLLTGAPAQDKALVLDALAKAQERANVNFQLATRLDEHAGRTSTVIMACVLLQACLSSAGHPSIICLMCLSEEQSRCK